MKRVLLVIALALVALSSYAYAQGFTYHCGTVRNNSDFAIVVYVKAAGGTPTPIGPHSSEQVCAGR